MGSASIAASAEDWDASSYTAAFDDLAPPAKALIGGIQEKLNANSILPTAFQHDFQYVFRELPNNTSTTSLEKACKATWLMATHEYCPYLNEARDFKSSSRLLVGPRFTQAVLHHVWEK